MSKFFINRPIVAIVIATFMVLVGLISMLRLPIAQFPAIVPPDRLPASMDAQLWGVPDVVAVRGLLLPLFGS